MIDETMNMPEPIIEPATSIVESSRPSPLTNLASLVVSGCDMALLSLSRSDFAEI
jgi:hypothetical protein